MWQSNAYSSYGHKLLKNEESKDQKDSKAKKKDLTTADSHSRIGGQSSQALSWSSKKDFYLNKRGQQSQSSNTLATSRNATII